MNCDKFYDLISLFLDKKQQLTMLSKIPQVTNTEEGSVKFHKEFALSFVEAVYIEAGE